MLDWKLYSPEDPESRLWDVVVVGAGMGGSVLGWSLARQNLSVLFLERGLPVNPFSAAPRLGYLNKKLTVLRGDRSVELDPYLGNGPGGSTLMYGAALERFRREDFKETDYEGLQPAPMPSDWPIAYDDFIPYYQAAEELFRVCGTADPRDPDDNSPMRRPPPLSERDQHLFDAFEAAGLAPYRLHVGIDYKPGCAECLGILCPRDCKSDAMSRVLKPALVDHHANLLSGFEVESLEETEGQIKAVVGKLGAHQLRIRGRIIVLAAGALQTPVILRNSISERYPRGIGNDFDLVGRGLMFHISEMFALWPTRKLPSIGSARAISSRALNVVDGRKIGGIQSMVATVHPFHVSTVAKEVIERKLPFKIPFLRLPLTAAAVLSASFIRRAALFSTLVEDFPYHDNRVVPDQQAPSGFSIVYVNSKELDARASTMRKLVKSRLAPHRVLFLPLGDNLNYGHPSGTCRFGKEPDRSVLSPENQVHGVANLYVVDSSFFPSSAGINPSLTIAANALRVADIIAQRNHHPPAAA
ncbi:GMC family oxidoreductase [Frankia sp. RB7]|nr:GMC family oxidoreductase [Frankia sp. RB7]